ncbi:hypothetical protein DPEC_G00301460 [Dallia pectoralis]|uniref:Uncharacterized protein n=1 Tax=Dallia pectoralis TaxID=75939 RepID=A0ACC2FGP5_DALPE|nr:hypothetical protein DPEC_G00301460 [Dallia pectoralis]
MGKRHGGHAERNWHGRGGTPLHRERRSRPVHLAPPCARHQHLQINKQIERGKLERTNGGNDGWTGPNRGPEAGRLRTDLGFTARNTKWTRRGTRVSAAAATDTRHHVG